MKYVITICMLLGAPPTAFAGETTIVNGARPWNFSQRSRENHLTLHMNGPEALQRPAGGQIVGGLAAGGQPAGAPYVSNSYAIGNWVQVDMVLGDGSEGLIMIENDQTNRGNQQSVSDILGSLIDTYQANDLNSGSN